jgi:hypothetical protein
MLEKAKTSYILEQREYITRNIYKTSKEYRIIDRLCKCALWASVCAQRKRKSRINAWYISGSQIDI